MVPRRVGDGTLRNVLKPWNYVIVRNGKGSGREGVNLGFAEGLQWRGDVHSPTPPSSDRLRTRQEHSYSPRNEHCLGRANPAR